MSFYLYQDIINGEGTIYTLKAKNKKEVMKKLKAICPFGWDENNIIKIKWFKTINKNFLKLLIKGILREDIFYRLYSDYI